MKESEVEALICYVCLGRTLVKRGGSFVSRVLRRRLEVEDIGSQKIRSEG